MEVRPWACPPMAYLVWAAVQVVAEGLHEGPRRTE